MILGVFFAGLLSYALFSRILDARSVTPQSVLLLLGLLLGLVIVDSDEIALDTELLKVAGEGALVLCLFVDAARIDVGALRGSAGLPVRLLAVGLPLTLVVGTGLALMLLPGIDPIGAFLVAASSAGPACRCASARP
jgi:NhaP-type Na+/H+ or K+/H+ antiporter